VLQQPLEQNIKDINNLVKELKDEQAKKEKAFDEIKKLRD